MRACAVLGAVVSMFAAGCQTGDHAVSQDGEFTFVSPGGQTRIHYPPQERGRVPDLTGESLVQPGQQIHLTDYNDKVVVINLWGSWCGPCRAEADGLADVQRLTASQGVQFVGVDVRDDRSAASDFMRDRGVTYPSIFDPSGRALLSLRNYPRSVVPSTIILDRQHRVAGVFLMQMPENDLLSEVQKVAAEPPHQP